MKGFCEIFLLRQCSVREFHPEILRTGKIRTEHDRDQGGIGRVYSDRIHPEIIGVGRIRLEFIAIGIETGELQQMLTRVTQFDGYDIHGWIFQNVLALDQCVGEIL